jgi:hypothetical protein
MTKPEDATGSGALPSSDFWMTPANERKLAQGNVLPHRRANRGSLLINQFVFLSAVANRRCMRA